MQRSLVAVLAVLALSTPVGFARTADPLPLRAQAQIAAGEVRLADLVEVERLTETEARDLQRQVVGLAPLPGQVQEIRRPVVQRLVVAAGVERQLVGAVVVKVMRASRTVDGSMLCEAAVRHVQAAASRLPPAVDFGVRCAEDVAGVEVGGGPLDLQVQPDSIELFDGRRTVLLDLRVGSRVERIVRVPLELTVQAQQWCATQPLAGGEPVVDAKFDVCRRPVTRPQQLRTAGLPLPTGRLKRALRSGETLSPDDVADAALQMRGDPVTVVFRSGALAIESPGQLGQDARIGDTVRVRLRQGESVEGRLASAGWVEVETAR